MQTFVAGDFNGLFGNTLCLSHGTPGRNQYGENVQLFEGMTVTAFEEDGDANHREYLVASGVVRAAPPDLACSGSVWVLQIDDRGTRHVSDLSEV